MKRPLDLEGERFGKLIATNVMVRRASGKLVRFCKCDCGEPTEVPTARLTSGHTKSCGCLKKDFRKLPLGVAARNEVLDNYKRGAKNRGYTWNISDELFDRLVEGNCWYCSVPPSTTRASRRDTGSFTYNGIDRVNNQYGYEIGNCVSCCSICNQMKMSMGYKDFVLHIRRIEKNMRGTI